MTPTEIENDPSLAERDERTARGSAASQAELISRLLFPTGVSVCVATLLDYVAPAPRLEERIVADAVETRKAEFRAGRACARRAVQNLGVACTALVQEPDRTPSWPAGTRGSISHCTSFCGAVAASSTVVSAIGFDAEPRGVFPEELGLMICSDNEIAPLSAVGWSRTDSLTLTFTAKEAFYKCIYPLLRTVLDFRDVNLEIAVWGASFGGFSVVPANSRIRRRDLVAAVIGRWCVHQGFAFSGAHIPARLGT